MNERMLSNPKIMNQMRDLMFFYGNLRILISFDSRDVSMQTKLYSRDIIQHLVHIVAFLYSRLSYTGSIHKLCVRETCNELVLSNHRIMKEMLELLHFYTHIKSCMGP